jgi:hypothetical protein
MAKKSVSGGRGVLGIQFSGKTQTRVPSATRSGGGMPRANQMVQKNTPYTNQPMVDKGRVSKTVNPFSRATTGMRYSSPIGPQNRGTVPGGAGIPGLNNVRLRPTAGAPKATVGAGTPAMKTATAGAGRGFGKAFADARRAGKSTFSFGGKSYTTAVKGEMRKAAGGTTARKATGGVATRSAGGKPASSFGKAFSSARAAGKSTFSYGGKSYSTAMKGESRGGGKVTPTSARAGTTATRARSFTGKSDVAGPRKDSSGRNVSSASGKRK